MDLDEPRFSLSESTSSETAYSTVDTRIAGINLFESSSDWETDETNSECSESTGARALSEAVREAIELLKQS